MSPPTARSPYDALVRRALKAWASSRPSGSLPLGVSLTIAPGSTSASLALIASGEIPILAASCLTASEPRTPWIWRAEMGWFGPVPIHEDTTSPRPLAWKAWTRPANPPPRSLPTMSSTLPSRPACSPLKALPSWSNRLISPSPALLRGPFFRRVVAGFDRVSLRHELSLFGLAVPPVSFVVEDAGLRVHPHHPFLGWHLRLGRAGLCRFGGLAGARARGLGWRGRCRGCRPRRRGCPPRWCPPRCH